MPTDAPGAPKPSEEDEKAARKFIYSDVLAGVGRGLEDLVAPYARFRAQAREAGRKTSMEDVTRSIQEQLEYSYERGREAGRREVRQQLLEVVAECEANTLELGERHGWRSVERKLREIARLA